MLSMMPMSSFFVFPVHKYFPGNKASSNFVDFSGGKIKKTFVSMRVTECICGFRIRQGKSGTVQSGVFT